MEYKCNLCEHEWDSRISGKPKVCPKCKRYDWETKKELKQKKEIKLENNNNDNDNENPDKS